MFAGQCGCCCTSSLGNSTQLGMVMHYVMYSSEHHEAGVIYHPILYRGKFRSKNVKWLAQSLSLKAVKLK